MKTNMALIKLATEDKPYLVKESYVTIRTRLLKADAFIEATFGDRKLIINKGVIEQITSEKVTPKEIKELEKKKIKGVKS